MNRASKVENKRARQKEIIRGKVNKNRKSKQTGVQIKRKKTEKKQAFFLFLPVSKNS